MLKLRKILFGVMCLSLSSCSMFGAKQEKSTNTRSSRRLLDVAREAGNGKELDLNQLKRGPTTQDRSRFIQPLPSIAPKRMDQIKAKVDFPQGESILYRKCLKAYQTRNLKSLSRSVKLFLNWYPKSVHVDNAVFLMASLALDKGYFAEAIKGFNLVIRRFPLGNKRSAAMFAKAVTYKRLNLKKQAKQTFFEVIKNYPGSPESFRAGMELGILKNKG